MNIQKFSRVAIRSILFSLVALAFSSMAFAEHHESDGQEASEDKGLVLVAGATGRTGRETVNELLSEGYRVRAFVRNLDTAREKLGGDIDLAEGDVRNRESIDAALDGVSAVISTIGAGRGDPSNGPEFVDYGGVKNLVDAAVAADVNHFVLMSSQGATDDSPENPLNKMFNNVLVWKLKGEDHLRTSGLDYTIVRASALEGVASEPGTAGLLFDQGDDTTGKIHRADCATVMIAALTDPDANKKTFELFVDEDAPADNWRNGGFAALAADE